MFSIGDDLLLLLLLLLVGGLTGLEDVLIMLLLLLLLLLLFIVLLPLLIIPVLKLRLPAPGMTLLPPLLLLLLLLMMVPIMLFGVGLSGPRLPPKREPLPPNPELDPTEKLSNKRLLSVMVFRFCVSSFSLQNSVPVYIWR